MFNEKLEAHPPEVEIKVLEETDAPDEIKYLKARESVIKEAANLTYDWHSNRPVDITKIVAASGYLAMLETRLKKY